MKTIQIITSYSFNNEPVIKNRLEPLIHLMLNENYKVILISNDNKKIYYPTKNFSHVLIPLEFKQTKNLFLRSLLELKISLRIIKNSRKLNGDLVFVTIPSVFLMFFLFKLRDKILHLDIRDLVWEYLFKNQIVLKMIKVFINFNFQFANSISYTNKSEYKNLLQYKFDKNNMYHISNGVSEKKFKQLKQVKLNKNASPTVSYVGNIGLAQNLKVLLSVAKYMTDIKFNIVGDGIELNTLKSVAKKDKIKNVNFPGRVDWKNVLSIYDKTDILFLQLDKNFKTAFPSKLYEYICTGKFIIFVGDADVTKNLKKFENICVINPGNHNLIAKKIYKHIKSKNFRKISTLNRKIINQFFIREKSIKNFLNYIKDI